jgi:hypothetical protein
MEGFDNIGIGAFTNGATLDFIVVSPGDTMLRIVPAFYTRDSSGARSRQA